MAEVKCFSKRGNLGRTGCPYKPGPANADLLVPKGFSVPIPPDLTDEEALSLIVSVLAAAIKNDDYPVRAHLVGPYISFEDKSEEANMEGLGYGGKAKTNRGKIAYKHTYNKGGQRYHNAVLGFDGAEEDYDTVRIENKTVLRLCCTTDPITGIRTVTGLSLENIMVDDMKAANYTAQAVYGVTFIFENNNELNEDMFVINTGRNILKEIEALCVIDALVMVTDDTAGGGVYEMLVKTKEQDVNLGLTLGDALEDPTAWSAKNKLTGLAVDVLTAVVNEVTGGYTLTMDSMSPGWSAGDDMEIGLAAVSALELLDVTYYESNKITVEMTA